MTTYRRPQRVLMPHPIGHTLRALARWAIATSLSASGACAERHDAEAMGQSVPRAPRAPAAAVSGRSAPAPDAAPEIPTQQPDAEPTALDAGPTAMDAGP